MASITLRELRKSYGSTPVIHGISLEIHDGEFVALVGELNIVQGLAAMWTIRRGHVAVLLSCYQDMKPADRWVILCSAVPPLRWRVC